MTDQKSNSSKVILIIVALLVVAAVAFFAMKKPEQAPTEITATEATTDTTETAETEAAPVDVEAALSDRILGDTNAPLRIVEYASFTCSHCGDFHRHTFDQLKTNYIDTGKAYLVFADFPLNAPAMEASKVARCVPKDRYFDFIGVLFKEQEAWISLADYKGWLKTKAVEHGLQEGQFDACVNSPEIEQGIKDWMKVAQEKSQITSTPSFVINNKTTVSGAYQYDAFAELLNQEQAKADQEVSGQSTEPPADAAIDNPSLPGGEIPAAAEEAPAEETPAPTETPAQE